MEIWLDLLLCCKNGGRSIEGRIARPAFESVWSVDVIGFTPDPAESGSTGFQVRFASHLTLYSLTNYMRRSISPYTLVPNVTCRLQKNCSKQYQDLSCVA